MRKRIRELLSRAADFLILIPVAKQMQNFLENHSTENIKASGPRWKGKGKGMEKENERGSRKKKDITRSIWVLNQLTGKQMRRLSHQAWPRRTRGTLGIGWHETIRYTYCCRYKADSSLPYRSLHVKNGMSVIDVAGGCFLIGGLISIATFMPTSQHQWFS